MFTIMPYEQESQTVFDLVSDKSNFVSVSQFSHVLILFDQV